MEYREIYYFFSIILKILTCISKYNLAVYFSLNTLPVAMTFTVG